MIYPSQNHISSHFSSSMLDPLTQEQVESLSVEKQTNPRKTLKQMNQSLIEEEFQVEKIQEESFEFRKQNTFFCHPDDQINHPGCSFQNLIQEGQEFEQNPEKSSAKKRLYSGFGRSQFFTTQTLIDLAQIPRKREDSIKLMYQTQEPTALNSAQDKITQSEQMIEQFDRQQLECKQKPQISFLSSIKHLAQQQQNGIQKDEKLADMRPLTKRRSKLRQIQQKIRSEKKSNAIGRARFNLKQFHLKKVCREVPVVKKQKSQQLAQLIMDKVQSQNVTSISYQQQRLQTQKLVQMLTLAFIPQFQRLENQYKGEMEKIQQKIQRITKNNSPQQYHMRESNKGGKCTQRMVGSMSKQSVIRINLNEDFQMNQDEMDCLGLDLIEEERIEDYQRNQDELLVPMIKRTESEDQLFLSCRSEKSNI